MAETVRDVDRGYRRFLSAARGMRRGLVRVGIPPREGARTYPGTTTSIAQVAAWHERGGRHLPRRPWLSAWWTRHRSRNVRAVARVLERSLDDGLTRVRLARLGRGWVGEVVASWRSLRPLAPSTVRRKGSRRVLVETGRMRRAVRAVVEIGPR